MFANELSCFSSQTGSFSLVEDRLAIDDLGGDPVVRLGAGRGDIALAQVFEDFFNGAIERVSQAAAARAFDTDGIVSP